MIRTFVSCYRTPSPAWVEERILHLVRLACEHVPFYRDLARRHQISSADIDSLKAFVEHFPRTSSDDYREAQQTQGAAYLIDERLAPGELVEDRSSGSSGIPVSVYKTRSEVEFNKGRTLWHLVQAGLMPWNRALAIVPPLQMVKRDSILQRFGIFRRYTADYLMSVEDIAGLIKDQKVDAIYGQKSMLRLLGDHYAMNAKARPVLKLLVPTSERVEEFERRFFVNTFRPRRYAEFYGSTETGIIASRIVKTHRVDYNACFLSLGAPATESDLTRGSALVTSLYLQAQPILNIDLGDQIAMKNYDRLFELESHIASVEGRKNDYLVLANGERIAGATFYAALEYFPFMRQFRITQDVIGRCRIALSLNPCGPHEARLVEDKVGGILGGRIEYEIEYVDEIPIDQNGKTKILVSSVGSGDESLERG